MPGQDAAERRFKRRDEDRGRGARIAEETDAERETRERGTPERRRFEMPVRTGGRATIVERDNHEEFLEFHWDPESYGISKGAKWSEEGVEGGTPLLNYSGCSLTVIKFAMLLNEVGNHHQTQRSVEDSIEWLMNRLRPRTEQQRAKRGMDRARGRPWLNIRDPEASVAPPILVLFGLRDGFECVLDDVNIKTIFQNGPLAVEAANFDQPTRGQIGEMSRRSNRRGITRAVLDITLKEYVNAPE